MQNIKTQITRQQLHWCLVHDIRQDVFPLFVYEIREQPFDFYGGGAGRLCKKKFRLWFQVKKILRPEGPANKILRLDLGSAFALRNLFSHSKIRLSQSEICFRSPKFAFRTP